MKRLLEVLTPEERGHLDEILDISSAGTEDSRGKTRNVRAYLESNCFVSPETEEAWQRADAGARRRALSEMIWRVGCIVDKSTTAVMGLTRFDLGFGFKLHHTLSLAEDTVVLRSERR
ncbi:MAG: hypothetical protein HYY16_02800 [Planctomycetes bacterium]|nr:hypothetical protein [Planctomycetota bacterium]